MLMENPYYYLFYVMAFFLCWLNRGYRDYPIRALGVVTLLMGTNALSLVFLLTTFRYGKAQVNLICLFLTILLFGINYYFLYRNGKAQAIIETFDNKYQGRRPSGWKLVGAVGYSLLSIAGFFYLAYLAHQRNVTLSPAAEAPNTSFVKQRLTTYI